MKTSTFTTALAVAVAATFSARADLKLPAIFGDNMVLQQQIPVPVWGWAAPGAKVTVKFSGQSHATQANAEGRWQVDLTKLNASFSPQTLAIEAGETKTFTNVLVGEVWLGSGQSNMEKPIGEQRGQKPCLNAEAELAAAHFPAIRLFKVETRLAATPQAEFGKVSGFGKYGIDLTDTLKQMPKRQVADCKRRLKLRRFLATATVPSDGCTGKSLTSKKFVQNRLVILFLLFNSQA